MKKTGIYHIFTLIFMIVFMGSISGSAFAGDYKASVMRLLKYEGTVEIEDSSGNPGLVMENARFNSGDTMYTGEASTASIELDSTKIVTMDENSCVEFTKKSNAIEMSLTEGEILLDVQEKLDSDESLDIKTSTMVIGIRGTIANISATPKTAAVQKAKVIILEGTAQVTLTDETGTRVNVPVPAGQKLTVQDENGDGIPETAPKCEELTTADFSPFVMGQLLKDQALYNRSEPVISPINLFTLNKEWTYDKEVQIIAQSASKLYDGTPLTRQGDVLIYGLPSGFYAEASAKGSQTKAGKSDNEIDTYEIYSSESPNPVTKHFTNIELVKGQLVVDPAPITIWTGSASKTYDGTPLTEPSAGVRYSRKYTSSPHSWSNIAYSSPYQGAQALYGLCGSVLVHATNPITGITEKKELKAGEKLVVQLHDTSDQTSISYEISHVSEQDLPDDILLLYADNPDFLEQACDEAGWNLDTITKRIEALTEQSQTEGTITQNGLNIREGNSEYLMSDCTNVHINIDTTITNYNDRPLSSEESYFSPVNTDIPAELTATGSQTVVGTSTNTYKLVWKNEKDQYNYEITEDLGTLRVLAPAAAPDPVYTDAVTLTSASASKTYDGTPLTDSSVTAKGLPDGFTFQAQTSGSQTNADSSQNPIVSYQIFDAAGSNVTDAFTNVTLASGTLTVTPASVTITTGSASKDYDGTPLTSSVVSAEGLTRADSGKVTLKATGTITDAGSVSNTYTINWGKADKNNYEITEEPGTLTVNKASLTITTGSASKDYDGTPLTSSDVSAEGLAEADSKEVSITATGTITDAGSAKNTYTIDWGKASKKNYEITKEPGTLTVNKASLTITTGSASKDYDGSPLTSSEVSVEGLAEADSKEVSITATGTITDAGSVSNAYSIDWGEADKDNYEVTEEPGTLTVNKASVTITTGSASKTYDGTPLTSSEVSVEGLSEADSKEVSITVTGTITDAGSVSNAYTIDWGSVNTDNYEITEEPGTLTVNKASVTITTGSDTKTYDGTPLTSSDISVTGLTEADSALVTAAAAGTITDAGSVSNTYTIDWSSVNKDNYEVTENFGTLTVEAVKLIFNLNCEFEEASEMSWQYTGYPNTPEWFDGTYESGGEITCESFTYSPVDAFYIASVTGIYSLLNDDQLQLSFSGYTDAGTYTCTPEETFISGTAQNYSITYTGNTMTIEPAPLWIYTSNAEKVYDGNPLKAEEAEYEGLVDADEGKGFSVAATGTITEPGSTTNTYEITWGSVNSGNYNVIEELGTLTVLEPKLGMEESGEPDGSSIGGAGPDTAVREHTIEQTEIQTEAAKAETAVTETQTEAAKTETEAKTVAQTETSRAETTVTEAQTEAAQTEADKKETEAQTEAAKAETAVTEAQTEAPKAETGSQTEAVRAETTAQTEAQTEDAKTGTQTEAAKTEATVTETEAKAETAKTETQTEAPKTETTATETEAKTETPKTEAQTEAAKTETAATETEAKAETPKTEAQTEAPKTETAVTENQDKTEKAETQDKAANSQNQAERVETDSAGPAGQKSE